MADRKFVNAPAISVVVPALGRYQQLREAMACLADQTVSQHAVELVLVVDAADPEPSRIEAAARGLTIPTRCLRAPLPGAASAREVGWRSARSDLILFLDSDILASPQLVSEHLASHQADPSDGVAIVGPVKWARRLRVTSFMRWVERALQFNYETIPSEGGTWGHFITGNVSVKRSLLELAGGFDVERFPFLYEDTELGYRMQQHGLRVLLNRAASGEHLHAVTVDSYRRRMARVARAELRFIGKHPDAEPFLHEVFTAAMKGRNPRGRLRALYGRVPGWMPWLASRVDASTDRYFLRQLAPAFLDAWDQAVREGTGESPENMW